MVRAVFLLGNGNLRLAVTSLYKCRLFMYTLVSPEGTLISRSYHNSTGLILRRP